jgi:hypothetical protein
MYARTFRRAGQTRRFVITDTHSSGWEVREEQDSQVLRCVRYGDWHRVERARRAFALEALALEGAGWRESDEVVHASGTEAAEGLNPGSRASQVRS